MNFMSDWFPVEAKLKAKENGKEAANEAAAEMGIDNSPPCTIM